MATHHKARLAVAALVVGWLLPALAGADVVVLNDGTRFVGIVSHHGPDGVAIRAHGNDWVFAAGEVASVKIESAGRLLERREGLPARRAHPAPPAEDEPATAEAPHVVIYGTSWCGYCKEARAWFQSHNIPFEDRDLDHDEDARREVADKCEAAGFRFDGTIPVLDVNGEIIHGFSVGRIERALKRSG